MNVLVFCQYSFVRFVQSFINHSFPCLFHIHSFSMFNFIPLKPDSRGGGGGGGDAWVCVRMYCSKIWWILWLLIGKYICCIQTAYQAENKFMNKISDSKGHCGFFSLTLQKFKKKNRMINHGAIFFHMLNYRI